MRLGTPLTQRFGGTADCRAISIPCCKHHVPYQGNGSSVLPVDGQANRRADTTSPKGSQVFFNGEPRMSDKLFIDFWGATISADGIYAIVAAVIIVLLLVQRRLR